MGENKEQNKNLITRPPIVVVLGHVDHGKSSILEAIKDLKITSKESGGITQHIGAYQVEHNGKKITFIDTPGHEAFFAMRSRGAKIADIAVLVIAAEESIKPQTKEAIKHIKEAGIPFVVALNKIDKPEADPERVKRELIGQDVLVESMGGKIPSINISAKTKKGIEELLEMILLVAEMEELKGNVSKKASGVIVESYMDAKRGPITTLIIEEGSLKEGDIIGTKSSAGKIKSLEDFQGSTIKKAFPSDPVIILGFENIPGAGEEFKVFEDTESAKKEMKEIEKPKPPAAKNAEGEEIGKNFLSIIIKSDVSGSLEAIKNVLGDIPQEKAGLKIMKAEVGEINDSDIKLAQTSNSVILGFRVKTNQTAQKLALREKVRIMTFEIIYELAQTAKELLERKIAPQTLKKSIGRLKVLAVFKKERGRQIIGGKVTEGEIKKNILAQIHRSEEIVGKGRILMVQKEKDEVDSCNKGKECGVMFSGNADIQEGDLLEAYVEEKQKATL
jgi:translation initiation factor IF-2